MGVFEQARALFLSASEHAAAAEVYADLDHDAPDDWRSLAAVLAVYFTHRGIHRLALSGGQGSGKSTLAALIVQAMESLGQSAVALSLDDFYLSAQARRKLGEAVHPLLTTRGVPGTHDIPLCLELLDALGKAGELRLPVFDKGLDDRLPEAQWRQISGPVDFCVLEGWCVGATPEPVARLEIASNELERTEDANGDWRHHVNVALSDSATYAGLLDHFDFFVFLAVPDLTAVVRWRTEQEQSVAADRRMDTRQIERFVDHYQRLTAWMLESTPELADLTVQLGANHRVAKLSRHSDSVQSPSPKVPPS